MLGFSQLKKGHFVPIFCLILYVIMPYKLPTFFLILIPYALILIFHNFMKKSSNYIEHPGRVWYNNNDNLELRI